MHDQANDLRRLVSDHASRQAAASSRPSMIVVAGGKGGVGTTTIAVNLAAAMAAGRRRTILVDADANGGDAALLCGLEPRYGLAEVLAARRMIDEVLQPGPGGIQVLPGAWGLATPPDYPRGTEKRLLDGLTALGERADLLVLDGGNGPNRLLQQVWQAADLVLVVTAPETSSIIKTHARIKALAESSQGVPIHLLVNLAPTREVADDVQGRLDRACRRFLAVQLVGAGHVPADPHVARATAAGRPFVLGAPWCDAARRVGRLADAVAGSLLGGRSRKSRPEAAGPAHRGSPHRITTDWNTQETPNSGENPRNDSTARRPKPIATAPCR